MNFADVSSNIENSTLGEDIPRNTDSVSKNPNQCDTTESGDGLDISDATSQSDNSNSNNGDNSQNRFDVKRVRGLEDKVRQLTDEKGVLLLSMQTLTSQWASRADCSESDGPLSRNVSVLEANLREVEQENVCLSETLQRIRNVLEEECDHENNNEQEDKILKLKDELQRLDGMVEASGSRNFGEDNARANIVCARHKERISELEMEIYRLHEEKKSLLSSIVRSRADPNFTLSDDVNESDINTSDVMVDDVTNGSVTDDIGVIQKPFVQDSAVSVVDSDMESNDGGKQIHSPLVKTVSRDEEVQVNMSREDIYGLLGFLQRDLDKLKTALDQDGIARSKEAEKSESSDQGKYSIKTSLNRWHKIHSRVFCRSKFLFSSKFSPIKQRTKGLRSAHS
jgi:hypothetical protein